MTSYIGARTTPRPGRRFLSDEIFVGYQDTIGDMAVGGVGAAVAGLLLTRVRVLRTDAAYPRGAIIRRKARSQARMTARCRSHSRSSSSRSMSVTA